MRKKSIIRLCCSALCLALCLVLPIITGQIMEIGNMLCPMHIPVMLCGFLCGAPWGFAVGLIAPVMRSLIFGMPPIFPMGVAMSLELASYGLLSGLLYKLFPKKKIYIYLSLLVSMLGGRAVWGLARFVFAGLQGSEFPVSAFISGGFTQAVPGIILQIVLVPVIVIAVKKSSFFKE